MFYLSKLGSEWKLDLLSLRCPPIMLEVNIYERGRVHKYDVEVHGENKLKWA